MKSRSKPLLKIKKVQTTKEHNVAFILKLNQLANLFTSDFHILKLNQLM